MPFDGISLAGAGGDEAVDDRGHYRDREAGHPDYDRQGHARGCACLLGWHNSLVPTEASDQQSP
jgi:hypothetical protein